MKHSTIKRKVRALKSLLKHDIRLGDADSVVRFLNECSWTNGSKDIAVNAYRDYLAMRGLSNVKLPEFRVEESYPFMPLEAEIDTIVSSVRIKTSSFLRVLKETAARPIEAWRVKWLDIDIVNRAITLRPAKYSKPRKLRVSEQTLNMVLALPRTNAYVFSVSGEYGLLILSVILLILNAVNAFELYPTNTEDFAMTMLAVYLGTIASVFWLDRKRG